MARFLFTADIVGSEAAAASVAAVGAGVEEVFQDVRARGFERGGCELHGKRGGGVVRGMVG